MKTILILTDFSKSAANAAETGMLIAEKFKANILLLNAGMPAAVQNETAAVTSLENDSSLSQRAGAINQELLRLETFSAHHEYHAGWKPAMQLINVKGSLSANVQTVLREHDITMVVMGGRSKPNNNSFYGSDIYAVLNKVTCPVLIMPQTKRDFEIKNLVFLTELPIEDTKTVIYLAKLSALFNFNIHLCHVSDDLMIIDLIEAKDVSGFTKAVSRLNLKHITFKKLQENNYVKALEKSTQSIFADMLAMVHKKNYMFWRLFNQTHFRALTQNPGVPLLIFPEQWGK